MKEWLSRYLSPSPSLAVALVTLVAATGGTAVAASLITGEQVKDGSLTGADVKDHSLTKADLAGVTAHASRRGRGRRGRRGPRGFKGPARPSRSAGRCWINKDCLGRWPCRFPVFNRRRWLSGRTLHGDLPGRELCCRWRLQRQHTRTTSWRARREASPLMRSSRPTTPLPVQPSQPKWSAPVAQV